MALAALLCLATASRGDHAHLAPPLGPLLELDLEQVYQLKVGTVYGASKYEQKVREAPASVSIITADEIQKFGYRTLADVLGGVRGLSTTSDRNYTYLGIRGFGRPADYNSRVLLLVDGHRVNDNIYDSATIDHISVVDVDLIDRVEVVRGPSSSVYGANAFFGVINVVTRRGRDFQGAEVSGSVGGYDSYTGRFSYGNRFTNGVEMVLSGTFYDSAGHRDLYYREFDDPATNFGRAHWLDGERSVNLFGSLAWRHLTLEAGYTERDKRIPTASFGTVFNDPQARTTDAPGYVDLKYEQEFGSDGQVQGRLYYGHYDYYGVYPYDGAALGYSYPVVPNRDWAHGQWVGAEAQVRQRFFERHTLSAGVEYRNNFTQDQGNYDQLPTPVVRLDARRQSDTWGVYGQGDVGLLTDLTFSAGLRYDYFSTFGDTVNPRLGLIWSPAGETTFKALFGQAYRAPNAYELYYDDGGITTLANPDLRPETIRTYELGYEQGLTKHLSLSSSLYYNHFNDLIDQQVQPSGLFVYENLDRVQAKGAEVELSGRFGRGLNARVSYALQQAKSLSRNAELSNSPRRLLKFHLAAPLVADKLFAGLELLYTSARLTRQPSLGGGSARAGEYWVANATLFCQKLFKNMEASLSVYNLLNQRYGDPGGPEHRQVLIPQDGRSYRFKLTYRF